MTKAVTLSGLTPAQIDTVKRTICRDANNDEFDLFMEVCRSKGLNPFMKQVFLTIYSKNNPEKRSHAIIVSRDGQRAIAQRCGDYRPAEVPPIYEYDENLKGPNNPLGLISATTYLFKQDKGGNWHPVVGQAFWDEFAPLKENWSYDENAGAKRPDGTFNLDRTGKWASMGHNMLAKCAETAALRAGWPDEFGGLYAEEEIRDHETEVTASEILNIHGQEKRMKVIGGPAYLMTFDDTGVLERVPYGGAADRVIEFVQQSEPEDVFKFRARNGESLKELWANDKSAALEIKKRIEAKIADYDPTKQVEDAA